MFHSPWPGGLLPMGHLGPIFPMYRAKGGLKAPFTPKIGGSGTIWPHLRDRASGKPPIFPDRTRAAIPRATPSGRPRSECVPGTFPLPCRSSFPHTEVLCSVEVILLFCWHGQLPRPTVRFSSNDLHRFWESSMLVTLTT